MNKLLLFVLSIISLCSHASQIGSTIITRTMMDSSYGENVFIQLEKSPVRDNCHSNGTWDYVLSTETEIGRQMLSQVAIAQAAQKTVKMVGNETCLIGSAEQLRRIEIY